MIYSGQPRPGFGPLPGASLDLNFLTGAATVLGRSGNLLALLSNGRSTPARHVGPNRGGLRVAGAGQPRIAYHARSGLPRGLLIEPAGNNFLLASNDFGGAAWTKANGATANSGSGVGLDGQRSAWLYSDATSGTAQGRITQTVASSGVTAWCGGFHIRETPTPVRVYLQSQGATRGATFDLQNGRVASVDPGLIAFIEPMPFGLFRCAVHTFTASGDTSITLGLSRPSAGDPQAAYEINEAFLENRTAPSSLIPTTTAVGARTADSYSVPLAVGVLNPNDITLYVESEILAPDLTGYVAALRDGTAIGVPASRLDILRNASGPQFVAETSGGTSIGALYGAGVPGIRRVAFSARMGTFIAAKTGGGGDYIDTGQGVITSTTGTMPAGLVAIDLGHMGTNGVLPQYLRRVAVFPRALSAAELSDLLR